MTWDTVQQVLRIGLGWAGAALVSAGIADADLVASAEWQAMIGALMMLAQFVWWALYQRQRAPEIAAVQQAKEAIAANSSTIERTPDEVTPAKIVATVRNGLNAIRPGL